MKNQEANVAQSNMDADAIIINEVMESYVRAGFSRRESLELVKQHIWTNAHVAAEKERWAHEGEQ